MDGKEFLSKMHANDPMVWDELIPMLRRIALGACRDLGVYDAIKEDIAQDVALRVFTQWQTYTGQSSLSTWLYAIARNRCLDELRKRVVRGESGSRQNNKFHSDETTMTPPEASYDPKLELMLCVHQLLAELDAQGPARRNSHRMIDVLIYWVEHSPTMEELADFLQITVQAAKQRMYEIRKRIEQLCRYYCGHDDCTLLHTGGAT